MRRAMPALPRRRAVPAIRVRSAVTVSLVSAARGGPFVFWDDLPAACAHAARLGFDGVEIFPPSADAIAEDRVAPLLGRHVLKLAAVGTGGGWVVHKLTFTSADPEVRSRARQFAGSLVDAAGRLGAPAIIGSMQGRWDDTITREVAIDYLTEALDELADRASRYGEPLLYEPLNRYETNIATTLADGMTVLRRLKTRNVRLLADLFHMNIEETNIATAIRSAAGSIGHVHLADSNRRPAGSGHTDFAPIAASLRQIGYHGYISAECLPWPDPYAAAARTIEAFRANFQAPP